MNALPNVHSQDNSEPARSDGSTGISLRQIERILQQGTFSQSHGVAVWGSNYAELVSIHLDNNALLAIYKPQRGERPLWDFTEGTLCYREMLAFSLAQALQWPIVPPTVLREGPYGLGSVQYYIEHNPSITYFNLNGRYASQLQRFALFDAITNNADRKGGHLLLDADDHLWGIDHGLTFHATQKLRTVIWNFANTPIPDTLLLSLQQLLDSTVATDSSPLMQTLRSLLVDDEVSAFVSRVEHLLQTRTFPAPTSRMPIPWPPI